MGLLDTSRDVLDGIKKIASIEVQQKVIELQAGILDLQQRVGSLEEENRELRDKLNTAGSIEFRNGCYWRTSGSDRGPFCARCWDALKHLVHLAKTYNRDVMACNNCNHSVDITL